MGLFRTRLRNGFHVLLARSSDKRPARAVPALTVSRNFQDGIARAPSAGPDNVAREVHMRARCTLGTSPIEPDSHPQPSGASVWFYVEGTVWCGREDSNFHAFWALPPQGSASTNSATTAMPGCRALIYPTPRALTRHNRPQTPNYSPIIEVRIRRGTNSYSPDPGSFAGAGRATPDSTRDCR
jgi:hypothetical protein